MEILSFTEKWLPQAALLAYENYLEECDLVPALPREAAVPDLRYFAQNGLGAAAVEGETLLGFLCGTDPWTPAFCTPSAVGIYSPAHAHGTVKENRLQLYRRLYQAAAEKWVKAGASSHAITLYAHDDWAREAFYFYGFGLRCMDLVRKTEDIPAAALKGVHFSELPLSRHEELLPLRIALSEHLSQSPSFMKSSDKQLKSWLAARQNDPPRVFTAELDGRLIAYMEVCDEGEHFASFSPGMQNICGAYCLPEHRGSGTATALLSFLTAALKEEGNPFLGVDCESFNPTALGFWSKHFTAYTHSVVRRIDENALEK